MPRPSLKDTRTDEILEAFMRCVARYGLDGSTLERISEEAGIGRPLLRHYLGNREQMVAQFIDYVTRKFDGMTTELFDALPETNRMDVLIGALFGREDYQPDNAAVFQAMVAASDRYPGIRASLLKFITGFEERVAGEIQRQKPQADAGSCAIAASGLTAIYFNTAAIMPLKPENHWQNRQRQAAQRLLENL